MIFSAVLLLPMPDALGEAVRAKTKFRSFGRARGLTNLKRFVASVPVLGLLPVKEAIQS